MKFFNNQLGGYRIVDLGEKEITATDITIPGIWEVVNNLPMNVPLLVYNTKVCYWGCIASKSDSFVYIWLLGKWRIRIRNNDTVSGANATNFSNISANTMRLNSYLSTEVVPKIETPDGSGDNGKILKAQNGEFKLAVDLTSKYSGAIPVIPTPTTADNGKVLKVVNGTYKLVTLP